MHEARNSYETGRKREHKYWPTDKLECFVCGWIYLSPLKADIGSSNKISSDTDTLWADTLHPQQSRYIMPRDFIAVFPSKYHALRPFRRTRWLIPVSDRSIEANFTVPSGYRYIRVCVCSCEACLQDTWSFSRSRRFGVVGRVYAVNLKQIFSRSRPRLSWHFCNLSAELLRRDSRTQPVAHFLRDIEFSFCSNSNQFTIHAVSMYA